jgi:hypothetical protein
MLLLKETTSPVENAKTVFGLELDAVTSPSNYNNLVERHHIPLAQFTAHVSQHGRHCMYISSHECVHACKQIVPSIQQYQQ